ncbi:MAG: carbohydrate-binding family 9-like protein [Myxococcota bacterium]
MSKTSRVVVLPLLALALASCAREAPTSFRRVTATEISPLPPGQVPPLPSGARALVAEFDGTIRLLGASLPADLPAGATAELTLVFEVLAPIARMPKIFVHGRVPGAEVNQLGADHAALSGRTMEGGFLPGDILEDRFRVTVPAIFPGQEIELFIGLYEGKNRWAVTKGADDGDDRVSLARVPVPGGLPSRPTLQVPLRRAPIAIDGRLEETDWAQAPRAGPFLAWDGVRPLRNRTWVRALWDDENLYVAFECEDSDVHTPYTERDDPLYESEAVEVFLDADGDGDEYVELQAAPNDVHFDAAFRGGRRKNFETTYNVAFETRTHIDGTFNDGSDTDRGFVSEWRIPLEEIRDLPGKPAPGTRWRANFFRLDRRRSNGRVTGSEASAWSSPLSGDFHHLARFGDLVFSP